MKDSCTGEWGKEVLRRVKFNVYHELLYLRYVYMTTPDRRDDVEVRSIFKKVNFFMKFS